MDLPHEDFLSRLKLKLTELKQSEVDIVRENWLN